MSDKWKKILSKVAPALAIALPGPLGPIAAAALGSGLVGKSDASEEEIAAKIETATPADLLKLRELDQQFRRDMKAAEIDVFRLEVEDKKSARDLYRVNYWPQILLSVAFIGGYFAVLGLILTGKVAHELPTEWQAAAQTIVGILTAAVTTILGFWFGSSFGSREKTAALAQSTPSEPNLE